MHIRLLVILATYGLLCTEVNAQSIALTPETVTPPNQITWDYNGTNYTTLFGVIDFKTTSNSDLYTFCIDLTQDVVLGTQYVFNYTPVANAPVSMVDNVILPTMGSVKAEELSQLYGLVFNSSNPATYQPLSLTSTQQQAFQVAISNIVFDTDWSVSNGAGSFYLPNSDSASLAIIAQANTWLTNVENEGSGGFQMPLTALTNINYQDQIVPVPEPADWALLAGLLASIAFAASRIAKRCRASVVEP